MGGERCGRLVVDPHNHTTQAYVVVGHHRCVRVLDIHQQLPQPVHARCWRRQESEHSRSSPRCKQQEACQHGLVSIGMQLLVIDPNQEMQQLRLERDVAVCVSGNQPTLHHPFYPTVACSTTVSPTKSTASVQQCSTACTQGAA